MSGTVTALDIFGTNEPVAERRILTAGPLTAVLEDGNLRTIRFAGVEVVRAINYLARDSSWGTYKAGLSDISVSENRNAFQVAYTGLFSGSQERFSYRMTISGDVSGTLTLEAQGTALTDFPTNRTGFVVLHPADAAGGRLVIEHSNGDIEETTFPDTISPDQPAFDIAALSHEPSPGLVCTVKMQGDVFEMEDQRNWTDASFKTFVRPLSKPRPYVIAKGSRDVQRITISIRSPLAAATPNESRAATVSVGGSIGHMPSIALFLDPDDLAAAMANVSMVGPAQNVIVRFDIARGHDRSTLKEAEEFAAAIDARLAIEAVFDMIDPKAEAMNLAEAIRSSNLEPGAVLISPRREFTTRPSNTLPPDERPVGECVAALRAVGVHAPIGAGTASYFTEFNRNPPDGSPDFVFFGSAAIVHAADDISVMETIGVFPSMIASARNLCSARPVWLGPCTIGMRHNPYGPAVAENPARTRMPAAGDDPRHGALFGAAFVTGVAARAAAAGVDHLIVASPIGRFGLLDSLGKRRPLHAVHAELAIAAGTDLYEVAVDHPGLAAMGFRRGESIRILIANLTSETIPLALPNGIAIAGLIDSTGTLSMPPSSEAKLGPYRTMVLNSIHD